MNKIENEKGVFVELPRDKIKFYGNTEEEKKANELIFDLSLELSGLYDEIDRLKNIIDELEKLIDSYELGKYDYEIPVVILKDKLKELKNKNK